MQALISEIALILGSNTVYLPVNQTNNQQTLAQLIQTVIAEYGYSSRIFLYQTPLSPLSKLSFISPNATLFSLVQEYPRLALTFNNTQFIEEMSKGLQISNLSSQFIFLIIQARQNNAFYHQTYKITHDCKMLFLISIAANYGRYFYLQYYDFAIPLNLFETQETVANTLKQYCVSGNYLVITSETQQQFQYYKTVKNRTLIDNSKYLALEMPQRNQDIIINRQAQWNSVRQILSLIWSTQLCLISSNGKMFKTHEVDPITSKDTFKLRLLPSKKQNLQKALLLNMFIGQTQNCLCFIEQSHILHLFSLRPPYQLINSVILQSQPSVEMDQQIPVLVGQNLVMFNITVALIILKYYQLPLGNLLYTKHFNWHHKLYGPIKCDTLNIIAVPLINQSRTRVFHINTPNDYLQIDCPFEEWEFWTAKDGLNNFSNTTGLFAILKHFRSRLEIYNLKTKTLISAIELNAVGQSKGISSIHFSGVDNLLIINLKQNWIEYDFGKGRIVRNQKHNKSNQQLCYTPSGNIIVFTQKTFALFNSNEAIRTDHTLLREGDIFFSKDRQHLYWNYESIYNIQKCTQNETHQTFLQISSNS